VRPEGANHQWKRDPPGELSIDAVADERLTRCRYVAPTSVISYRDIGSTTACWAVELTLPHFDEDFSESIMRAALRTRSKHLKKASPSQKDQTPLGDPFSGGLESFNHLDQIGHFPKPNQQT
jgi:hypothetical protein